MNKKKNVRGVFIVAFESVGCLSIIVGLWMIWRPLALIALGIALLMAGYLASQHRADGRN